ncbi:hypothetical protein GGH96_001897 [Coemansia sp. RSA 1972]|nr:hypothetical protein GGH96_001897 [Coemansia sp. RSA 1972]
MADGTDAASTQALAAAVAAVTAPGFAPGVNPAMAHMHGTAPFPKLQPETVSADQAVAAAVTAALTGVTAVPMSGVAAGTMAMPMTGVTGQMTSPMSAAMLMGTTVGDSVLMGTTTMSGNAVLASLQHNAHDQMMEIMHTYHTTNAHRRRSSVEAAAAASSVLASIASSAKPYMDGDMAAAAAMAAAGSPTHVTYSARQQQTAAAALLAASSMGSGMLPTIPSGAASLRNTPPPGSDAPSIGASLAGLAFATLSPQTFSAEQTFAAEHQITDQQITANDASLTATPARRNPDASLSSDENDNDDDGPMDEDGMPLTPGAPGSGRPGSLRHLTTDERRARRLQRNRLAAKECRQKKKAYIQNLEDQVCALQDDNAQLRKTIEELNAKLTLSVMRAASSASTPVMDAKRVTESADESVESMSSPALAKRPRVAERSTSNTQVQNGD